jgi:hypothetical protein
MRVHAPTLEHSADADILKASVGDLCLWFKAPPGVLLAPRIEPFLPMALMGAMAAGEALEVAPELPVSPRLLEGLGQVQDILHVWNPRLHKVEVKATSGPPPERRAGTAVFFSGGVDATYSFLQHEDEVTHLVTIHGLDIPIRDETRFPRVEAQGRAFAARFSKLFVPVGTNARDFGETHRLGFHLFHGAILAGTALALGFGRTFVGSSSTYGDLVPWGTHPLLDPLWSTEASALVHDGAEAGRAEKLLRIAARPEALTSLRVCFENTSETNCGRCEKCLRTMMALRLLGKSTPTLPTLSSMEPLRRVRIQEESEVSLFTDNLRLAREKGDRDAERAIRGCLRRYEVRKLLRGLDGLICGGRLLGTYKRLRWGQEKAFVEVAAS